MKHQEALDIIKKNKGYMVSFEKVVGSVLKSDYFPDKHAKEPLIQSQSRAWELAAEFAVATDDNYVNIYVIDERFSPVPGYSGKILKKR